MSTFIVEFPTPPDADKIPAAGRQSYLKAKVAQLAGLVEIFNVQAKPEDQIEVKGMVWLNTTVQIEATAEAAQKLAKTMNLKVERPRAITRD